MADRTRSQSHGSVEASARRGARREPVAAEHADTAGEAGRFAVFGSAIEYAIIMSFISFGFSNNAVASLASALPALKHQCGIRCHLSTSVACDDELTLQVECAKRSLQIPMSRPLQPQLGSGYSWR